MLLLSFSLAALSAGLSWQEGGWLFFVPAFVAFSALWDLVGRWRFQTKINILFQEETDGADALVSEREAAKAKRRILATPIYFVLAVGSLIAGWIW